MAKKVLMLGAGPLQVPAIEALKRRGYEVISLDYDRSAPGFAFSDKCVVESTLDLVAVKKAARECGANYVITSTSDAPVGIAAMVSEELGLPTGISYEDAICATSKDEMRLRLRQNGVPIPDFIVCDSFDEYLRAVMAFSHDCVVKPVDSAASRGVRVIDDTYTDEDLRCFFEDALSYSRKKRVIVEQRIRGAEVSVEAITVGGSTIIAAITDKIVTPPPYSVELGHIEPSSLSNQQREAIAEIARHAIDAIGIIDGPSHTEVMVTEGGPKIIEIAARLGGDFITSKLVPLSTGIDLVQASVDLACGHVAPIAPTFERAAGIIFLVADKEGVLRSMDISDEVFEMEGFVELELYKQVGDFISTPHSSGDRIGHLLFQGNDPQQVKEALERAMAKIDVQIVND